MIAAASEEPEEPTDEDVIEAMGGEQIAPGLPQGRETLPTEDSVHLQSERLHEQAPEYGQDKGGRLATVADTSVTGAREDEVETLDSLLLKLPAKWMRLYIRELYRTGSPAESRALIAPTAGGVSLSSLEKARRECAPFDALCRDAMDARHERVFSAIYRGATEGDVIPLVSQGQIVGEYKRRSDRAGEVWLKAHGLMADQKSSLTITHQGKVEMSHDEQLGGILDIVTPWLFLGGAPVIEAEAVKDGGEGVSK